MAKTSTPEAEPKRPPIDLAGLPDDHLVLHAVAVRREVTTRALAPLVEAFSAGVVPGVPGPEPSGRAPSLAGAMGRLRELIDSDGRSHAAIGAACVPPISPAQISHVYTGHRRDPSISTVARILASLGRGWPDLGHAG